MRITHQWNETRTTVRIEGLPQPSRVLHVTDSHISLCDERDQKWLEGAAKSREHFAKYHVEATGRTSYTEKTFAETIASFKEQQIDLIALTGDIVQLPSKACVDFTASTLKASGIPWLYTAGNHDWNFGNGYCSDELRQQWWPALQALHDGEPAASARVVNGLNFIAIDDSNYQITAEQLAFTKQQLGKGLPSVLLVHIPLSLPTLRPPTVARWNSPILIGDPDWSPEPRTKWGTHADDAETLEFIRVLSTSPNLAAVLCGHIHFPHADNINPRAMQYVGRPGYEGGARVLDFQPL